MLSVPKTDISLAASVFEPDTNNDTLFGLFVTLGNDSGADGASGFDGVRDIVVHAGVRDDAGDVVGTRGYVFSGADGALLFTFTVGDAPPPGDPPCCGGDGDTEPIGPIDPDGLINTIIDNMGMEGAGLEHGDLDATTTVTTEDLILAVEWIATGELPAGASAATAQDEDPIPGGTVDCIEGDVDENGEPCVDGEGTTGGGGNNNIDCAMDPLSPPCQFDSNGDWAPCKYIDITFTPELESDCTLIAWCTAAKSNASELNKLNKKKRDAIENRDRAVGDASEEWNGNRSPSGRPSVDSPRAAAEKQRLSTISRQTSIGKTKVYGGKILQGVVGAAILIAVVTTSPVGAGVLIVIGEALGGGVGIASLEILIHDGAEQVNNAITTASNQFESNGAHQAFKTAVAIAEAILRYKCSDIERDRRDIMDKIETETRNLEEECIRMLEPELP